MTISYEAQAKEYYSHCNQKLLQKAIGAGIYMDKRLVTDSTKGGHTHTFFDVSVYLKYFSFEALVKCGYYICE